MSAIGIAKTIGGPGSLGFLVVSCIVGLVFSCLWPKRPTVGRAWLFGTLLIYIVLALPLVASSIAGGLPPIPSVNVATVGKLDELIVLGGDNEKGRIVKTLDVWRGSKPDVVVLLGDEPLRRRVEDAGVPAAQIRQNDVPATTRAQMAWIAAELRARPVRAGALIASQLQMPRVIDLAQMQGVRLYFLSSPLDHDVRTNDVWSLIPSYGALEVSRDALYERAALSYYRSRGWTHVQP